MKLKDPLHLLNPLFTDYLFDPKHTILRKNETALDWESLKLRIYSLAKVLIAIGMKPQDRIAVVLPRGLDAAIAIYSILYGGGVYVPLDINNPKHRLSYIIRDAGVKIILGETIKADWCPDKIQWLNIVDIVDIVEVHSEDIEVSKGKNFGGDHLAAILYTSGSAGKPKGVALSHRAMCAFTDWAGEELKITTDDTIASLSPFYFDLSVFDLFTSLHFNACVNFMPNELTMSPAKMALWLAENEATIWYTVPSVLSFLVSKGNLLNTPLPRLRVILFAGEIFPTHQFLSLSRLLPHVMFYNLYGPTETNVCSFWPVNIKNLNSSLPLPIGFPACGNSLKIDPENEELLVTGPTLMSGYWQDGCLKNVFDEEGWYRTGDRVSINDHGEFVYKGRLDRMVKIFGYRIEPREIEDVIYTFSGVQECAVIGITDQKGQIQLAACIAARPKGDKLMFKKFLNQNLPAYMHPTYICWTDTLPRLNNGKLDHKKIEYLVTRMR